MSSQRSLQTSRQAFASWARQTHVNNFRTISSHCPFGGVSASHNLAAQIRPYHAHFHPQRKVVMSTTQAAVKSDFGEVNRTFEWAQILALVGGLGGISYLSQNETKNVRCDSGCKEEQQRKPPEISKEVLATSMNRDDQLAKRSLVHSIAVRTSYCPQDVTDAVYELQQKLAKAAVTERNNFHMLAAMESNDELQRVQCSSAEFLAVDPNSLIPTKTAEYISALKKGAKFDNESMFSLLKAAAKTLRHEPSLVELRSRDTVAVVGDLDGSIQCLMDVRHLADDIKEQTTVVFNGDFFDQGEHSHEVIFTLLLLKLAYPTQVFLCRGNHDDSFLSAVYGFEDEMQSKCGDENLDTMMWCTLSNIFSGLPVSLLTLIG